MSGGRLPRAQGRLDSIINRDVFMILIWMLGLVHASNCREQGIVGHVELHTLWCCMLYILKGKLVLGLS